MRKPKVVIVGAGPAGGSSALALARSKVAEVLLLDKSKYPRVKVCGSGLSPHAVTVLESLGLRENFEPTRLLMVGLLARGPLGGEVHLRGSRGAWVVPRRELDHGIASEAERHGAEFRQDTKVTDLLRDPAGRVRGVKVADGEIEADLVICANGSPSRFARDDSPATGIRTIMGWWKDTTLPKDEGIFVFDRRLEGYYAWSFPEPGDTVNVGLTIPEHAPDASRLKALFRDLLDEHFGLDMRDAVQVGKWMGHPATVTTRVGEVAESHCLWAGEAARLVSPATVEGIGFALESGTLAADLVQKHYELGKGLSGRARALYRGRTALRMLPKFWCGEAFVRVMRNDRARNAAERIINPQWFAAKAATLVGERHP
jgi:menaquinone-9 beta-reductase